MGASMPKYGSAERTALAEKAGISAGSYVGSAEQNAKIVASLNKGTSPIIQKQSGIIQGTDATKRSDTTATGNLENKVTEIYGQNGTPTDGTQKPQFDPYTGKPLSGQNGVTDTTKKPETPIISPAGGSYLSEAPEGFDYLATGLPEGKQYVYGADGRAYLQDTATGKITTDATADNAWKVQKESIAKEKEYNDFWDMQKQGLDRSHQAIVDLIKQAATRKKQKMEELNKRMLGLKTVQGYRTGSAEYTPEIDTGILGAEIKAGEDRLEEIESAYRLELAKAVADKENGNIALLGKRMEKIDALQDEKRKKVQDIYKLYMDHSKMINDKIKEANTLERANRDQAIQELATKDMVFAEKYNSYKTQAQKDAFINETAKSMGLDADMIKGAILGVKSKKEATKSTGGNALAYTPTELKKLRAEGIDAKNTKMADAFLYKNILPEEYTASLPQLSPDNLIFNFGASLEDEADKISKINMALMEGYSMDQIGQFMGFSKDIIELFKKAITTSSE